MKELHLDRSFIRTKQAILWGKRYHDMAMNRLHNPRRYTQFRSWAKKQPCYQQFIDGSLTLQRNFSDHCDYVNDARTCLENWEVIKSNLCDDRITHIDVRKLDIHQLARAKLMTWCIYYNGQCGGKKSPPDPEEEGIYDSNDVDRIYNFVINDPLMTMIDHQPNKATSLMKTTTLKVIRHCRSVTE